MLAFIRGMWPPPGQWDTVGASWWLWEQFLNPHRKLWGWEHLICLWQLSPSCLHVMSWGEPTWGWESKRRGPGSSMTPCRWAVYTLLFWNHCSYLFKLESWTMATCCWRHTNHEGLCTLKGIIYSVMIWGMSGLQRGNYPLPQPSVH